MGRSEARGYVEGRYPRAGLVRHQRPCRRRLSPRPRECRFVATRSCFQSLARASGREGKLPHIRSTSFPSGRAAGPLAREPPPPSFPWRSDRRDGATEAVLDSRRRARLSPPHDRIPARRSRQEGHRWRHPGPILERKSGHSPPHRFLDRRFPCAPARSACRNGSAQGATPQRGGDSFLSRPCPDRFPRPRRLCLTFGDAIPW